MDQQLALFNHIKVDHRVQPANHPERYLKLASELPSNIHMGTSSWSVPGWQGSVYDELYSEKQLARQGLAAYVKHPLFRMVGIDRTYYAPIDADTFADYARHAPPGFRFMVKAHDHLTTGWFPDNPRYGKRAGLLNSRFLDVHYATDAVVAPALEGLGSALGPIVFQFPPQSIGAIGGPQKFADRLYEFLSRLPAGPQYATEIRNDELLTQAYGEALCAAHASHVINVHPNMPPPNLQIERQYHLLGPALVVRWMLRRNLDFASAQALYQPYSELREPDLDTRHTLAELCSMEKKRDVFLTINNKAEGCSPLSIAALIDAIVARSAP